MDGLDEQYRGVLTIATTNHPDKLDPALLFRPSRFDYRFEFPLPDPEIRRVFVLGWMERLFRLEYVTSPGLGVEEIVRDTHGMSQAYLKRLLIGSVTRMYSDGVRGDEAFMKLVRAELAEVRKTNRQVRRTRDRNAAPDGLRAIGFLPGE